MKDFQELIARALVDEEFGAQLLSDPEALANAEGVELKPAQLKQLRSLNAASLFKAQRALDRKFLAMGKPSS